MIEIKDLGKEECKLKRIHRQIKNNAQLNQIKVERRRHQPEGKAEIWEYDFIVLTKSRFKRWLTPYTLRFWAKFNTETCTLTIGNVEEHLFDRIFAASKVLFEDIDGLTVVIEKDYC